MIVTVPITKGKATIEYDTDKLPEHVYIEAVRLGLKELSNRGMTKITVAKLEGEELAKAQKAAMDKAAENQKDIYEGKIRIVGAKTVKVSGKVNTEAMRLARNVIKDRIKALGKKVSHYAASEITKAAKALLATDDGKEILAEATLTVEKREKMAQGKVGGLDLESLAVDPKLVAKAEKDKADKAATLSAAKAGQTTKTKPKAKAPANA